MISSHWSVMNAQAWGPRFRFFQAAPQHEPGVLAAHGAVEGGRQGAVHELGIVKGGEGHQIPQLKLRGGGGFVALADLLVVGSVSGGGHYCDGGRS